VLIKLADTIDAAHVSITSRDQLADAAPVDPLIIRQRLLTNHPRHLAVLNLTAERAGWDKPLARCRAAVSRCTSRSNRSRPRRRSLCRQNGLPKVERVVCAVDCGIAINPDVVKAQMEGGMGCGLSAVLFGAIDLEDGAQSNFHDYRVLRINEMPDIEVRVVSSKESPTGVGEPGMPPIGPAVANAWARLTGQRSYKLPFTRSAANGNESVPGKLCCRDGGRDRGIGCAGGSAGARSGAEAGK
jgi:isoquinoline 1-oxidoreductase subunit beta